MSLQEMITAARARFEHVMAEKLWRMDTSKAIETYVRTQNRELKEELNVHHSKSDIKLF